MEMKLTTLIGMLATIISILGVIWKIAHDVKEDWKKEVNERSKEREERIKERVERANWETLQKEQVDKNRSTLEEILQMLTDLRKDINGIETTVKESQKEIATNKMIIKKAHRRLDKHEEMITEILKVMTRLKIPLPHKYTSQEYRNPIEDDEDEEAATMDPQEWERIE